MNTDEKNEKKWKKIEKSFEVGCLFIILLIVPALLLFKYVIKDEIKQTKDDYKKAICFNSIYGYNNFLEKNSFLGIKYKKEIIFKRNKLLQKINALNSSNLPKKFKIRFIGSSYVKFDEKDSTYVPIIEFTKELTHNIIGFEEALSNDKEDIILIIDNSISIYSGTYKKMVSGYTSEDNNDEISKGYGFNLDGFIAAVHNNDTISKIIFDKKQFTLPETIVYQGKNSKTLAQNAFDIAMDNFTRSAVKLFFEITNEHSAIEMIKNSKDVWQFYNNPTNITYYYDNVVDSTAKLYLNIPKTQMDSILQGCE